MEPGVDFLESAGTFPYVAIFPYVQFEEYISWRVLMFPAGTDEHRDRFCLSLQYNSSIIVHAGVEIFMINDFDEPTCRYETASIPAFMTGCKLWTKGASHSIA